MVGTANKLINVLEIFYSCIFLGKLTNFLWYLNLKLFFDGKTTFATTGFKKSHLVNFYQSDLAFFIGYSEIPL